MMMVEWLRRLRRNCGNAQFTRRIEVRRMTFVHFGVQLVTMAQQTLQYVAIGHDAKQSTVYDTYHGLSLRLLSDQKCPS